MEHQDKQSNSSAASVRSAAKTAKAISNIAKGAAAGPYGLAAGLLHYHSRKIVLMIVILLLLPVLFVLMLPSVIFNGLLESGETPILNDDAAVMKNISDAEIGVWSIIDTSHNEILQIVLEEISHLSGIEVGVIKDDYSAGTPVDSARILSQYSACKDYREINIKDLIHMVDKHKDKLFSYTVSIKYIYDDEGRLIQIRYTYNIHFVGEAYFADKVFELDEEGRELAGYYATNLLLYRYGTSFDSGGTTGIAQVSADVMKYDALLRKYAAQYGISQYIEVLRAIMMAESGGRLPDVMQSAEGPYNMKYPKKPNGITDPEYSIDCGVHEFADCLIEAGCRSPADRGKLSLALQGYNYGTGYIRWAMRKYGGYSEANAKEFSDMMKAKLGWNVYGNPRYVADVLRYLVETGGSPGWGSPFVGRNWTSAVTSEFGYRTDPITGKQKYHSGMDIAFPKGTPINAVKDGTVTYVKTSSSGYGYHLEIDHGNGVKTLYGHCSKILVKPGQKVTQGTVIALVGSTGRSTGPHLHINVEVNGELQNPRNYIKQ